VKRFELRSIVVVTEGPFLGVESRQGVFFSVYLKRHLLDEYARGSRVKSLCNMVNLVLVLVSILAN
jgi:hypothetical protein